MKGMPRYPKLSDDAVQQAIQSLPGWTINAGKLHRDYQFKNFAYAFGFMAAAAPQIEKMDHHPEWANVYNRVSIDLVTHDSGGITQADVNLAVLLEEIATKLQ